MRHFIARFFFLGWVNRGNGDLGFQLYRYHKNVGTIGLLTARTPPQETITNEITIVNLKNREN